LRNSWLISTIFLLSVKGFFPVKIELAQVFNIKQLKTIYKFIEMRREIDLKSLRRDKYQKKKVLMEVNWIERVGK